MTSANQQDSPAAGLRPPRAPRRGGAQPAATAAPRARAPRAPSRTDDSEASSDDDGDDGDEDGHRPTRFHKLRARLRKFLSAPQTEWTIIGLSMLDFLFCFAQISWLILRDPMCECRGTCDDGEPEWLRATNMLSLCITGAFVVEIPVDLLGFGLPYYTTMRYHWLHVADSLVILTAFILEVVLQSIAGHLASLMTVLRLWRVVKLVSTAEIGLVDYNELTIHEEERRLWHREQERMGRVVRGLRAKLERYEGRRRRGRAGKGGEKEREYASESNSATD